MLSGEADAVVKSMAMHARKPADLYPTPPDATAALMEAIFEFLPAGADVWEPACAAGEMSRVLETRYNVISTELREHSGYGEGGIDFLTCEPIGVDAIITNPPFSVADKFIERAVTQAAISAMLLKSQYWHAKTRLALFERHPPSLVLPLTWRPAFLEKERGKSPLMDVLWCVWLDETVIGAPPAGTTVYRPLRRVQPAPHTLRAKLAHLQTRLAALDKLLA